MKAVNFFEPDAKVGGVYIRFGFFSSGFVCLVPFSVFLEARERDITENNGERK